MDVAKKIVDDKFWALPIIYMAISIIVLRSNVTYVYMAAGVLILFTALLQAINKSNNYKVLAMWLATLAAIGISASVILSIEKIELLIDPDRIGSCSLSPVIACSPVIGSEQASAFGFPNPFIGIFGFTAVFTAAMTMAAGAKNLSKIWWRTLLAGMIFGVLFSSWLIYQGVFVIGKLCLYCLLVWIVTFTAFWLTASYAVEQKYLDLGKDLNKIIVRKKDLLITTYLILFAVIFLKWSDYWLGLI